MESNEIRFKYKNRGRRFKGVKGLEGDLMASEDPDWFEVSPGRFRRKGSKRTRSREDRAANKGEFMERQVTKHELLVRDIDEGKF